MSAVTVALDDMTGDIEAVVRIAGVAMGGAFAAWAAQRSLQRDERLDRIALVAEAAQVAILHPVPRRVGAYAVAVRYVSAAREAVVGGDFYEVIETPRGVRVAVGDVRGKGLPAVRLAATALGAFRETAYDRGLDDVARAMDRSVTRNVGNEDFVTVVLVQLGLDGRLELVNCGHPAPLLLGGGVQFLAGGVTTPLGLSPEPVIERFTIEPGERLIAFTDGLIEARDTRGRFFPVDAIRRSANAAGDVDSVLAGLVDTVIQHAGGKLDDDLAVVLVEDPRPPGPDVRRRPVDARRSRPDRLAADWLLRPGPPAQAATRR
jgi:serine phosphatase RsbU (regulator of sigma subunit)